MPAVTFTLDLEDLRTSEHQELRVETAANRVFDELAERDVTGSVYVVGQLAEAHPGLVKRIAEDGHEIGLHAYRHAPLGDSDESTFVEETTRGREVLEEIAQAPVTGYRAPMMSLVPESAWTIDKLADMGFTYSSSVLPGPSPLYGWPGLPHEPFLWSAGLIEFPCPLVRLPGINIPYLGGTYLRLFPDAIRRYGLRKSGSNEVLWTYCHPWEFDPDEQFYNYDYIGGLASRIAWLNRKAMLRRVGRVLDGPLAPTLGAIAEKLDRESLEVVEPRTLPMVVEAPGPVARAMNGLLRRS